MLAVSISLAKFRTAFSPADTPVKWIEASKNHVLREIYKCDRLSAVQKDKCISFTRTIPLYNRFMVYVYVCVALCDESPRLLDELQGNLGLWQTWDDVTSLQRHRLISRTLWGFLEKCRNLETEDRLHILLGLDVIGICALIITIRDKPLHTLEQEGTQAILSLLQAILDEPIVDRALKRPIVKLMLKLCRASGVYPECLVLKGVEKVSNFPIASGQFGDVWKGRVRGYDVAIKVLKIYEKDDIAKLLKGISSEIIIWRQTFHPNVLPFYGIYHWNEDPLRVCLISPWMDHGNIMEYLKNVPDADRGSLILDVARGLEYLHTMSPPIIHGDLKGLNILITSSVRACLTDFGLSTVARESQITSYSAASSAQTGGTLRWMAPELLDDESETIGNTTHSDVYSFACVCYEIFSGHYPFYDIKVDYRVIQAVTKGKRPPRPARGVCETRGLDNDMWKLIESCWRMKPQERPRAPDVVNALQLTARRTLVRQPPHDWDESFVLRIRSTLSDHPLVDLDQVYSKDGNWTPLMNAIDELQEKEDVRVLVDADASPTPPNAQKTVMMLDKEGNVERDLVREGKNLTTVFAHGKEISNPETVDGFKNSITKFVDEFGLNKFFKKDDPFLQRLSENALALSQDTTTPLSNPENIKLLTRLSLYQLVIYCDDSGSMATNNDGNMDDDNRYKDQCELVARIARIATRIVPENLGIELRFINSVDQRKLGTAAEVDAAMQSVMPYGSTNIGTSLIEKILKPLVYRKISDPNQTFKRPILVCAITDGCPYPEPSDTFKNAVMECMSKLVAKGFERTSVMFVMSQIGNDNEAVNFLYELAGERGIQEVLYCVADQLDCKFKEMKGNEKQLDAWLLNTLTKPFRET